MVASAFNMSSSPKQPYQSQIHALSKRLDRHDERFDQLESKLDLLTQAFEKSPIYDQLKYSNLLLGRNEHHTVDKPSKARRFGNYRESTHVDYERIRDKGDAIHNLFKGRRSSNANVSCSDITQKVQVDVPTYDGKINAATFYDWIVAM